MHAKIREQFVATLTHDLRNPLSVAKIGADLIRELALDLENSDARNNIINLADKIAVNMKRADRMIQDLLTASLLRIGEKIRIKISQCDLFNIACEVVNEFEDRDKKRIHIVGGSARGYWDCDGLERSLENLIKNAIKYGAAETPITVKIVSTDSGRVQLSVHNLGNPISEQDQKLIFRAFGRSKSAQKGGLEGWGIGLALVRAVSESLGGQTRVESSQEAGTTFIIDLPEDSRDIQTYGRQMH